ncbi:DMT family transporter [Georgenia satyanarayanai]|uniref:DMT family transporter n=1 Tax=Georgenia satyanarayanai TaxID=860221 RepID=UPI00203D81FF|nr:DMT family transporter [Georgenia satyanarayanai]MCM3660341.1 DMT family transporter [Georgenia satyanarayanai]
MALAVDTPLRAPAPTPRRAVPRMRRRLGVTAIIASATAMGLAGVFGRLASPPGAVIGETLTLGRMAVGALGMVVILTAGRRLSVLRRTRVSWSVVLGGVFLGLSLATYLSATVLTVLSRAVALHYLGPVIATVLARVILKERARGIELASLGLSFAGMVLATGLVDAPAAPTGDQLLGDVLAAASGVLYGAALLCYRYRADMPADVRNFWNFTFGALGAAGMVAITRPDMSGMTAENWVWAGIFFVVCGLLALGLLVVAGTHLRSVELSALSYWEVVVAMLLGAAVYGEAVSPVAWAGAGFILVAMAVALGRRRPAGTGAAPSGARGERPAEMQAA